MARFKENDRITNGNVTLWITGVTEREYEFTDHDMDKFFLPIEGVDRNYCLYESKSIWHTPDEPIEHDKEVLIEYETGFHDVACYDKNEDVFYAGAHCPKRKYINRWAYIKDLTQL